MVIKGMYLCDEICTVVAEVCFCHHNVVTSLFLLNLAWVLTTCTEALRNLLSY